MIQNGGFGVIKQTCSYILFWSDEDSVDNFWNVFSSLEAAKHWVSVTYEGSIFDEESQHWTFPEESPFFPIIFNLEEHEHGDLHDASYYDSTEVA